MHHAVGNFFSEISNKWYGAAPHKVLARAVSPPSSGRDSFKTLAEIKPCGIFARWHTLSLLLHAS